MLAKLSHPKILNVLKCIAAPKIYSNVVKVLHYTGILVNNVDELFRLCM